MTGTRSSQMKIYLTAVLGFALTSALIIFPKEAFAASLEGLKLWFEVVMPAPAPVPNHGKTANELRGSKFYRRIVRTDYAADLPHPWHRCFCRGYWACFWLSNRRKNHSRSPEKQTLHPN